MIYFLRHPETGRVKIGTTINYHQRLSALIAEHGDLELIGLMEGGRNEEQELHERFEHIRAKDMPGREWFECYGELTAFIYKNASFEVPEREHYYYIQVDDFTKRVFDLYFVYKKARTGRRNISHSQAFRELLEECLPDLVAEVRELRKQRGEKD